MTREGGPRPHQPETCWKSFLSDILMQNASQICSRMESFRSITYAKGEVKGIFDYRAYIQRNL